MKVCKRDGCDNEARARSPYCSKACKQSDYRNKCNTPSVTDSGLSVTSVTPSVTPPSVTSVTSVTVEKTSAMELTTIPDDIATTDETMTTGNVTGLDHYQANPDMYVQRQEPDKLDWGRCMTADQLADSEFKWPTVSTKVTEYRYWVTGIMLVVASVLAECGGLR